MLLSLSFRLRSGIAGSSLLVLSLFASSAGAAVQVPAGFTDETLVSGLDAPTSFAFLPDGRVLVVEQNTGRVRLIVQNHVAATDPVFTRTGISTGGERGLLGIAVDPRWPAFPWVYLIDTRATGTEEIIRYVASGDLDDPNGENLTLSSGLVLIDDIVDAAANHNAGCLRFGDDGCLYVSLGDDASPCSAADSSTLRGAILRLRVTTLPGGSGPQVARSVIAPPDNPFAGSSDVDARLVYAFGFRNPFRFQIDPVTDTLVVGDVGEATREEMDRVGAGDFLGWPWREGTFSITRPSCPEPGGVGSFPYVRPIREVPHDEPVQYAIISAGAYRPVSGASNNWPVAYHGDIFYSQYYQGYLRRLEGSGSAWSPAPSVTGQPNPTDWATGLIAATDFQVGPDGSLWWLAQFAPNFASQTGSLHRIVSNTNTGVGERPLASWSLRAAPNPFAVTTELAVSAAAAERCELAIHDLAGRRVRSLFAGTLPAGERRFAWSGDDERGVAVGPGVYFARLVREGAPSVTIRILRVR